MAPTVSTEQLARLLCRDVRTIQRLGVQGVLVRARNEDGSPKRGSFEMIPSIQGFIHYLDDQLGLAALHDTDFRIERTGLVKAQREHAELELAIFKGQLHRAADVEAIMNDLLSGIKMRLLAIPSRLARLLLGVTQLSRVVDLLTEAIESALGDLMTYNAAAFAERNPEYLKAQGIAAADLLVPTGSENGDASPDSA